MSLIACSLAALFAAVTIMPIAVLYRAYRKAFTAYWELRTALAACDDRQLVTLRMTESRLRPAPILLRPAPQRAFTGARRRAVQPELRAAA